MVPVDIELKCDRCGSDVTFREVIKSYHSILYLEPCTCVLEEFEDRRRIIEDNEILSENVREKQNRINELEEFIDGYISK